MGARCFLLVLAVATAGCSGDGLGVSTADECIAKYAIPAGTGRAVLFAHGLCRQVYGGGDLSPSRRRWAECLLPKLATVKNDTGFRAAGYACREARSGASSAAPINEPAPIDPSQVQWDD